MTTDNFEKVLLAMMRRRPFKPFTVELHGNQRFEIDHPEATVIRQGVAVFMAPGPVPCTEAPRFSARKPMGSRGRAGRASAPPTARAAA